MPHANPYLHKSNIKAPVRLTGSWAVNHTMPARSPYKKKDAARKTHHGAHFEEVGSGIYRSDRFNKAATCCV